ncbi:membrane protein [Gordonia phage Archimedes]|uniref:Membrane protein n=1 Tax=Gordonia phage Archimedes TaxID=2759389 RepID=A0A7L7SH21_9CAUD|nr:membrane protein [Gordonia phage Archimedes]QOC55733.1 membrane protein [Gordonia phage Archimedes]
MNNNTKQYLVGAIAGAAMAIGTFGFAGIANAESGDVTYPNRVQPDSNVTYPNRIEPNPDVSYPNPYEAPGVSRCPKKESRAVGNYWERQEDGTYAWVCRYASVNDRPEIGY